MELICYKVEKVNMPTGLLEAASGIQYENDIIIVGS